MNGMISTQGICPQVHDRQNLHTNETYVISLIVDLGDVERVLTPIHRAKKTQEIAISQIWAADGRRLAEIFVLNKKRVISLLEDHLRNYPVLHTWRVIA